ncbi:DUF3265 domain-containing protein [Vibrio parahaemolyticus]|nr:DUF3265 domain-containing protein [Vibrio parahaemolyticus]
MRHRITNCSRGIHNAWHLLPCVDFSDLGGVRKHRIALLTP